MFRRLESLYDSIAKARSAAPGTGDDFDGGAPATAVRDFAEPVRQLYRHCPQCGSQMARRRYRLSAVVLDECLGHGVWFDKGEIQSVTAFLERGGLDRARQDEARRAAEERLSSRAPGEDASARAFAYLMGARRRP